MNEATKNFKQQLTKDNDVRNIFGHLTNFRQINDTNYKANSPFTNEKTPSFIITIKPHCILFNDFSSGKQGDIFTFIEETHNLNLKRQEDFKKAFEILSDLTGVPMPDEISESEKSPKYIEFQKYHNILSNTTSKQKHLQDRGIKDLTRFGYDGITNSYKILSKNNNKFNIIDYNTESTPKYKNEYGMDKSYLFNLNNCKSDDIYITEGIFDCLNIYEIYNKDAAALLGSDIQNKTINLLKRYKNIILVLDNDRKGQESTLKIIHNLYKNNFMNVFYVDYDSFDFQYKDINEAVQNKDYMKVEKLINNPKSGFNFLIKKHVEKRKELKNDLEETKLLNTFIDKIVYYHSIIQSRLLDSYKNHTGEDIKSLLEHNKNLLIVDEYKQHLNTMLSQRDFTMETIEEIGQLTKQKTSNTLNMKLYTLPDFLTASSTNSIKSTLMSDVKYFEGSMAFIGGRTSHGKTTLMINEAVNLASQYQEKIAFISLEESYFWITAKLFLAYHNKKHIHYENELITLETLIKNRSQYEDKLKKCPELYVIDNGNDIDSLEKYILSLHTTMGIKIFFIDYIQRIIMKDKHKSLSQRQEEIKHINARLLELCKTHNLYMILGTQLNRAVLKKSDIKSNSNYREAGDIEQDANLIINIWNNKWDSDKEASNEYDDITIYVAKNRNGKSGIEYEKKLYSKFWCID